MIYYLYSCFSVLFCTLLLWHAIGIGKGSRRQKKRPSGPLQLPILGSVLHMLPAVLNPSKRGSPGSLYMTYKPAYIIMDRLSKKFGALVNLQFGVNHAVVISSAEFAKAVCCREEFAARFADGWFVERSFGKALGLIFNNGEAYKELKRFTNRTLKDFGFGKKKSMEAAVTEELIDFIHDFGQRVEESLDQVLHMEHSFTLPVLNVLWNMIGGVRFSYDDLKLRRLISIVEELSRTFDIGGNILMAFPFLRHIAPEMTGHTNQMKLYGLLHQFFREILFERKSEGSYAGNPKDFIDIFLQQMDKHENEPNNLFTEEQFIMVCLDLFTAGSETTANTLDFAILYMIRNPDVQKKVQNEIDNVIGMDRLPDNEDRQRMPYTEATLLEVQRVCNVIPLVHRVCTTDTKLGPYDIDKDDVMVINLHSIHMNEEVWGDPYTFRPERFLDANGALKLHPSFMPFGMGKRACLGEILAKLTMFIYFTAILQRFTFQVAQEHGEPSLKPGKGFTISPEPFYAYVKPRI